MTKVLIAYFSQGKTTKNISQAVSEILSAQGFNVDLYNIAENGPPDLKDYDMLGIGSPVYVFRPPFNVTEYVKALPDLDGMPFFCFLLYGTLPGVAGNVIRETLSEKGGREIGFAKFRGADYFLGYLQRGVLFSPDHPKAADLETAGNWAKEIAGHYSGAPYQKPGRDEMPGIVYSIEELITRQFFITYCYTWLFKADKEKCDACKICTAVCPKGNVRLNSDGLPQWGRECIFCLYCQMKCPRDAVKSVVDWPVMAPFMGYNVSQALKDSSTENVRVIHSKGRTRRLEKR